ncbi:MAG: hypothetical protein AAFY69_13815 [Pseudomonadota bacterium]
MSIPPEQRKLAASLHCQGMPRRAARRMAEEWFAHREDLEADARIAGFGDAEAAALASASLGATAMLLQEVGQLPDTPVVVAERRRTVVMLRWGSASLAGLATTVFLFAGLTRVIGI